MFCFEEFKHSSSCILKCNSFYLIFWDGVMSFLIIFPSRFMIHKFSRGRYLNPSFSVRSRDLFNQSIFLLELYWVIFHLQPFLRNVASCGAYQWSNFLLLFSVKKFFISLVLSIKSMVSISGRLSPHGLEMFSISPQQACSFRCWFSNNSFQPLFIRILFQF